MTGWFNCVTPAVNRFQFWKRNYSHVLEFFFLKGPAKQGLNSRWMGRVGVRLEFSNYHVSTSHIGEYLTFTSRKKAENAIITSYFTNKLHMPQK